MPADQEPYDPYIPSGESAPQQQGNGGNARTQALQAVSLFVDSPAITMDDFRRR